MGFEPFRMGDHVPKNLTGSGAAVEEIWTFKESDGRSSNAEWSKVARSGWNGKGMWIDSFPLTSGG